MSDRCPIANAGAIYCLLNVFPPLKGMVEKIVAHGGKQRMPIREYYPGEKPFKMCYVEDPFGLIFEVYSHSYSGFPSYCM